MDKELPKLLVVAGNKLAPQLAEYALNVAVRLDLEILVLFLDEGSSSLSDEERRRRVELFKAKVEGQAKKFTALARKSAIKVTIIVDVNNRETAVTWTREQDPEIRFILSAEPNEFGEIDYQHPQLTVIRSV
jgi:argonaute-like protein implicated in RNA metabolism and viral defense